MNAIDVLENILNSKYLPYYDFKYCLVDKNKIPHTYDDKLCRPNRNEDFVSIDKIANAKNLSSYKGIGISVKASNITAIDIDKCFSTKFDINSADDRATYAINLFKDKAYIEFSFSGTGLRILFKTEQIKNYSDKYYTKNSKTDVEFYHPAGSARYVTLTGKTIADNSFELMKDQIALTEFLDKYMLKPIIEKKESVAPEVETRKLEELLRVVKNHYLVNFSFQELWFNKAEGSRNGESDNDFRLLTYLYVNITKDKETLRILFENSPRFKSKDAKHVYKWNYQNHRYFEFMFAHL